MTTAEYAAQHGVSSETVRRWIREGKVHATQRRGVWDIPDEAHHTHATDTPHTHTTNTPQNGDGETHRLALLASYDARIASLERMLEAANEARQRGDSIIMQLSLTIEKQQSQLRGQTLLIEDLRKPLPLFKRLFRPPRTREA